MSDFDKINVEVSKQRVKFLRHKSFEEDFWSLITKKLGMRKGNII